MHVAPYRNVYADVPGERWLLLMVLGLLLIFLGAAAIAVPLLTAIAITKLIGVVLVIAGVVQVIGSSHLRATDNFWPTLLSGILTLIVGVLLLGNPTIGILAIALLISMIFFVGGLFRISVGLTTNLPNSGWLVFGGIMSLILGILLAVHWPSNSPWIIALFVGIDLIYLGILLIETSFLVHMVRRDRETRVGT